MAKRSKFFCIAVEGATCDGRTLDATALQEMADTYDAKTYTARVNMEHIRGFSAEPPFNAYGDVVALETREVELQLGGKAEKKLGLFAQVDALETLVQLQGKGQKLFSSIELNPNFASTGKAYLQGLAVTDSPASLGTEIMEFAAGKVKDGGDSPFCDRKIEKGNFFSAAHQIDGFDFEPEAQASESSRLFAAATAFFEGFGKSSSKDGTSKEDGKSSANDNADTSGQDSGAANDNFSAAIAQGFAKMTEAVEKQGQEFGQRFDKIEAEQATLKASIEDTPKSGQTTRPAATGGKYSDTSAFC